MSMLAHASPASVALAPFPHLVIDQALDRAVCQALLAELPSLKEVTGTARPGSNRRFDIAAVDAAHHSQVGPTWKRILAQHIAQPFFAQFIELFAESILHEYPDFETHYGDPRRLRAGLRFAPGHEQADVLLDAMLSVNTPVFGQPSSVRGAHLDSPRKLYTGLFYLRLDEDDSTGGDLELYSTTGPCLYDEGHHLLGDAFTLERTVPYRQGTLALFLNTPRSLHGVSPRSVTRWPRVFINLNATLARPLFSIAMRRSWSHKLLTWPARKWRNVARRLAKRPEKPTYKPAA